VVKWVSKFASFLNGDRSSLFPHGLQQQNDCQCEWGGTSALPCTQKENDCTSHRQYRFYSCTSGTSDTETHDVHYSWGILNML
jgi:hypothetical protein